MQEEIRVMTLVRKAKLGQRDKAPEKRMEERFFTTDYFDWLIAKKYPLDIPLSQWMSEDTALTDYSQETAVQRYPLYFSDYIYDKYENGQQDIKRGDPFENGSVFKFLSVIQVYIAPEILRRLKDKIDVWCGTEHQGMLDPFLNDLYETVECFRRSYQNQEFVYRIYYALSAGDFTIVIKSRTPELSFGISTYLRSRISKKRWAVYKTYTLLAMEEDIGGWENDSIRLVENRDIGKFVLRGCYSWKYWAECPGNEDIEGIDRLNGRYDISAELSEQEFAQLYDKVSGNAGSSAGEKGQKSGIVTYLTDLIDKKYLSYVNERYLMRGVDVRINDADAASQLVLDDQYDEELYILNQNFIRELRQKHGGMEKKYAVIFREHKSLRQYFELLKRQIDFCSVLNEQSDTRIYAGGMEQLLEAVLDSLGTYRDMYQQEKENGDSLLGELIVQYLGKAVYSINTYMEYVRNNNLQSLQTPNYNIESDMGMEKILIGYSEYLKEFVRFYVENNACMSNKISFLPIVVPNICEFDITVEALFPDDKIFNLARKATEGSKKLLIINSPSMMELEDIPMAMAMLCHEIAHQFRYESREDRNKVLLQLFAVECAEVITGKILARLQTETGEVITYPPVETILQLELSYTIREILTSPEYGIDIHAPLDYLRIQLNVNLLHFFDHFCYISKLDKYVQLFIRQVNEWENVDVSSIGTINKFYKVIHAKESEESCLGDITKAAEEYLKEVAEQGIDNAAFYLYMEDLLKKLAVEDRNDININVQEFIVRLHKKLTKIWQERTIEYAGRIGEEISANDYRMWALAGRYLGLDAGSMEDTKVFEKNRDRFLDVMKQAKLEEGDLETPSRSISTYREITSDIFMCCVMGLSPFAYLNVIVTNMWRADLIMDVDTIERIITVILTIGISDKGLESGQVLKGYNEICLKVLDRVGIEIKEYLPEKYEEFHEIVLDIEEELGKYDDEPDIRIVECKNRLEDFRYDMEKQYEYKNDLYIKIDKMLLVCRALINEGEQYIEQLYGDARYSQLCRKLFLKQDYDMARSVLSEFREKMKDDFNMAQLYRLHHKIADYLERLYETGKVTDGGLNREGIEFLLKMFYSYKFQHAESGGR